MQAVLLTLALASAACSGPSVDQPAAPVAPAPTVTSIAPSSAMQGGAAFTLTVNGSNFVAGSTVYFGGAAYTTTFVSASTLTALIPASAIREASTPQVTVVNPAPGPNSNGVTFTILPVTPLTVTAISPSSVLAGATAFTLTATGTGFTTASTVSLGGTSYATTFVSATSLTALIPASAVATAGTLSVTVANVAAAGSQNVISNVLPFTVLGPLGAASFNPTGSMQNVSGIHMTALLPNGKVLVAGGSNGWTEDWDEAGQVDAALYDPATRSFTPVANMMSGRSRATSTLLPSGKVLLVGGEGTGTDQPPVLASAEVYDPATGTFAPAGSMSIARMAHTATLLPNGKVLIVGGGSDGGWGFPVFGSATASAELYDPATNSFTPTGSMTTGRFAHTATLLPGGKVLIAGGYSGSLIVNGSATASALATTEIYDPATGTFTPGGRMASARGGHTATLLPDGSVLLTGGLVALGTANYYPPTSGSSSVLSSAELRDAATGEFTSVGSMTAQREEHTATLLPNGKVLVVGGATGSAGTLASSEMYDPATRTFVAIASMASARSGHSATLLADGTVLIAGGHGAGGRWDTGDPGYGAFLRSAEVYRP